MKFIIGGDFVSARLRFNEENFRNNIERLKELLQIQTEIIAMVKANAYGTGCSRIVEEFIGLGIYSFGVAHVSEGLTVRNISDSSTVIVTSQTVDYNDMKRAVQNNISLCMSNLEMLIKFNDICKELNLVGKVHLKLDSGMTRLGFSPEEMLQVPRLSNIEYEGIYTHLSDADSNIVITKRELDIFSVTVEKMKKAGFNFKMIHALNSSAVLQKVFKAYEFTHVRLGIVAYGYYPAPSFKSVITLKNTFTLEASIINIRKIESTCKISYSGTYEAQPGSVIATIQIGYADGLRRQLSNKAYVWWNGKYYKIVGNICMDMCMVLFPSATEPLPQIGDNVEIFGEHISIDDIAESLNTINYEILSGLNERILRD